MPGKYYDHRLGSTKRCLRGFLVDINRSAVQFTITIDEKILPPLFPHDDHLMPLIVTAEKGAVQTDLPKICAGPVLVEVEVARKTVVKVARLMNKPSSPYRRKTFLDM